MSEQKERKPVVSAYKELSGILNALKSEEITLSDAMNKIQLKDTKPVRPYCKVTSSGALALYGISKQPLIMYADQWTKFIKLIKSDYVDNYMKYNESRLKFKNNNYKKPYTLYKRPKQHNTTQNDYVNVDASSIDNL